MLVTPCPRCGKPTPARLATPEKLRCDACGYDGPPPDAARASIEAARSHLQERDVRTRQISEAVRRASLGWRTALLVAIFVVACLPTLALLAEVLVHLAHPDDKQLDLSVTWSAFFSFLVGWLIGATLLRKHRRDQRAIRRAISAVPSRRIGESAACRICGADLPADSTIVRCRFCSADNYADARTIGRIEKREATDVAAYEKDLAIETSSAAQDMADRGKMLLVLAFVMPIGILVFFDLGLAPLAKHLEGQLDTSTVYASAMSRDGECVGIPILENGAYTLDFGSNRFESPASLGPNFPPTFRADALIGKRVRVNADNDGSDVTGVVEKAYGSPLGNLVLVRAQNGREVRIDVRGTCLVEPESASDSGSTSSVRPAKQGKIVDADGASYSVQGAAVVQAGPSGRRAIFELHEVLQGDHPLEKIRDLAIDGDALTFVYEPGTHSTRDHAVLVRVPKSGGVAHVVSDAPDP